MDTTFLKGLAVLEALAFAERPRGVSELARELDLTKSNVHRLLQVLVHKGYAAKDEETARYKPTLKIWEIGAQIISRVDVKRAAAPVLRRLADETGESVHLSILSDAEVVYIDKIDGAHPVRAYSQVGGRAPSFAVATGKCLLAFQPDSVIELLGPKLQRFTTLTVRNLDELRKALEQARKVGYAVNRGEWREGVCGVAAPICDSRGAVIAAVGISGPAARLTPATLRECGSAAVRGAADISHALGYVPALGAVS